MQTALAYFDGVTAVALAHGAHWLNISMAYRDYRELMEGVDAASIRSITGLLNRNLFNPGFFRRMATFVREANDPIEYRVSANARWLQPIIPPKVVGVEGDFGGQSCETPLGGGSTPILFGKVSSACIGPEEPILVRPWHGEVTASGALGVVIAKPAKEIAPGDAGNFIAGYTLVNDVTACGMLEDDAFRHEPWFRAKNADTFCPVGPYLVLPDTIPFESDLNLLVRVNGDVRATASTGEMQFHIPELLAHITRYMTLNPGDIVAVGSIPAGAIADGDVVEVEANELGVLRNPVAFVK